MRLPGKKYHRYQLTKHAVAIVRSGHPWIFKNHLSSAAGVFSVGTGLELVDSENRVIGYGVKDEQGAIGIRILSQRGVPDPEFWKKKLSDAIAKRIQLRKFTNGWRVLHGENDRVPGVVVDVYGSVGVLQTYSAAVDGLGRFCAAVLRHKLALSAVVWRMPAKRKLSQETHCRVLWGHPPEIVTVKEGKFEFKVPIISGQKGGMFLDLRHLRKWLALRKDLAGKRVLNLFSYTGTLGLACESAGASEIWNVDSARPALDFGLSHHTLGLARIRNIEADVFRWLRELSKMEKFDLIVIDPPQMASDVSQIKQALEIYRKLFTGALEHLSPRGRIVAACCTSRISRREFEGLAQRVLGRSLKLEANLLSEDDHLVSFSEGDYLKVVIYR